MAAQDFVDDRSFDLCPRCLENVCTTVDQQAFKCSGQCPMQTLPDALLANILARLDFRTQVQAERCCRSWHQLLRAEQGIWGRVNVKLEGLLDACDRDMTQQDKLNKLMPMLRWLGDRGHTRAVQHLDIRTGTCPECEGQETDCEDCATAASCMLHFFALLAGEICGSALRLDLTIQGVQLAESLLSSQRLLDKLADHVEHLHLDPVAAQAAIPLFVQLWPMCCLRSLKSLELGISMPDEDGMYSLPADMSKLTNLEYLEVTKAEDSEHDEEISLPSELCVLTRLTRMSFCMTTVPDGAWSQSQHLVALKAEEVLFILPSRPASFCQLMELSINCATVLGPLEALTAMTRLVRLSLTDVQPRDKDHFSSKLGTVLGGMTGLTSLSMTRCELSPNTAFDLHLLNRLSELHLQEMTHAPRGFRLPSHPSGLVSLRLPDMDLLMFDCSDALTALRDLDLTGNELREMPSGLTKLQSLRSISLERENLSFQLHTSADFAAMPQLVSVDLKQFPKHQWSMDSLMYLTESASRLRRARPKACMCY